MGWGWCSWEQQQRTRPYSTSTYLTWQRCRVQMLHCWVWMEWLQSAVWCSGHWAFMYTVWRTGTQTTQEWAYYEVIRLQAMLHRSLSFSLSIYLNSLFGVWSLSHYTNSCCLHSCDPFIVLASPEHKEDSIHKLNHFKNWMICKHRSIQVVQKSCIKPLYHSQSPEICLQLPYFSKFPCYLDTYVVKKIYNHEHIHNFMCAILGSSCLTWGAASAMTRLRNA